MADQNAWVKIMEFEIHGDIFYDKYEIFVLCESTVDY